MTKSKLEIAFDKTKNQKKLTFGKYFTKTFDKNVQCDTHFSWKDWFADKMIRQGYVIKDVKETETITISCLAAKANVSLKEREKMQKQINKFLLVGDSPQSKLADK